VGYIVVAVDDFEIRHLILVHIQRFFLKSIIVWAAVGQVLSVLRLQDLIVLFLHLVDNARVDIVVLCDCLQTLFALSRLAFAEQVLGALHKQIGHPRDEHDVFGNDEPPKVGLVLGSPPEGTDYTPD